jgi:tetratricopeptide (TPR) repeat protein
LWSTDHQAVIDLWKMLELNSSYSAAFAYNFILEAPDQYKYYLHPIGLILFYLGYTEQSKIIFKRLFHEIQINGATDLVQEENPGDFYIFVKQYNIALKIYTLERAIAKGMGDEFGTQFYLQRQADVYLKMNEPAKALNSLIKEIDNKDTLCSVYDKIEFLEKAVEITTVMDSPEQSLIFLYTIEKMAQEHRLNDKLQYCFGKQSEIYIKQENYEKAMELLKKQEALCRK